MRRAERVGREHRWVGGCVLCRRPCRAAPDAVFVLKGPIRYQRMVGRLRAAEVVVCRTVMFRLDPSSRSVPWATCPAAAHPAASRTPPPRVAHLPDWHGAVSPTSGETHVCSVHMSKEKEAKPKVPAFIQRVMPGASSAELDDATSAFTQYLEVVLRLYARLKEQNNREGDSPDAGKYARVACDHQTQL